MITHDRISSGDSASGSIGRDNLATVIQSNCRYDAKSMLALIVILVTCAGLYLALMRPYSFGSYHDDGLYGVLGKSLATGQGYRVISLPAEPFQTKSPPFYPFLLS